MTTTNIIPPDSLDPHDLIAKGETLATTSELAGLLGVSRGVLEALLHRELAGRVRFVRTPPGGGKWRYSVEDARAAIAELLPALEEQRRQRAARQAQEQADAAKRQAERQAAHAAHVARKQARGANGANGANGAKGARGAKGGDGGRPTTSESRAASPLSAAPSSRRHESAHPSERPATGSGPEVIVRRKFGAG